MDDLDANANQADAPRRRGLVKLTRRGFLVLGGAAAGVAGLAATAAYRLSQSDGTAALRPSGTATTTAPPSHATGTTAPSTRLPAGWTRWSDPASWSRGVPGPGQHAVVTRKILLDVDARVDGVSIMPGGQLAFDPRASRQLETTGNVVVQGRLVMRPASPETVHLLRFTGVREDRFTGGGMEVLADDVGLWVMDAGVLDLQGSARRAWTRAAGAVAAGATRIVLAEDPAGWRPGDELILTPTTAPADGNSATAYDTAKVVMVDGRAVTLDRPARFAHPAVDIRTDAGRGRVQTAEVLNLTRNVRVEGTPRHRAHIFIRSRRPQSLKGVAICHVAPRRPAEEFTEPVLGRYGLHFHMAGDGSRGSLVERVVVRDAGGHAFVPHLSNGVTFRDCISHDTFDEAYWWDDAPDTRTPAPPSHDIRYEHCVASLARSDPPFRGFRLAGFSLGRGNGNVIRDSVAVGIQGTTSSAGFTWPEGSEGVWTFERCTAHNNATHGIFVWQNSDRLHTIARYTAYHNGEAGISHGAYNNRYLYRDSTLYGNGTGAVITHANSTGTPLQFTNLACYAAGQSDYLVTADRHNGSAGVPTLFAGCSFEGARKAAFAWLYQGQNGPSTAELYDIVDCAFAGNEFLLGREIDVASRIRVRDKAHGSILLRRADQPGSLVAKWNARVTPGP